MPLRKAKVLENQNLTNDVFQLTLETEEPFIFQAGQFITIKIDDGNAPCFRGYSIASAPNSPLQLVIKVVENGRGSNWLKSLQNGATINFIGPNGKFSYKEAASQLFIATGTGIAPFRSIIEDELAKGNNQKMDLIFGVRHMKDIFYQEIFENIEKKHPNFKFHLTLSQPENDSWKGKIGRVTTILEQIEIAPDAQIYICGLKDMVDSVNIALKEKSILEENINVEKFD